MLSRRTRCIACRAAMSIIVLYAISLPAIYFYVLNALGPSTEYYEPTIQGAALGADGKYYAALGDKIFVNYIIVRHKINGNCLLSVSRYAENIGGDDAGKLHLLDYVDLRFVGQNELRRPRWPMAGLVLGYDVDKDGKPETSKPLLPAGSDSQEFALYVKARYFCNFVDYIIPRYLQGGERPNETERVNIIVRRQKHD